ncbi:hypothetical protein CONCODRAFT_76534 [Conidiobolus coronatus NRRL 28638]|uniref:Galactose oxidase n=1 Tax=Conidiobolus coronatus (strain ATCC 28846 / CBS 209.66 / NRRL 28638) TaxID=796925 RepID=A0A137PJ47_CONC2|nr:hypothetical protein CONCODRAFT_76534 [Conidiobolus coronatus NRRL 28638]|eukprot:KXN75009.1 hypothetical protein CONCODRAFT_76534 [Conidiobolus coronatus NRRL 28638]
MLILFLYHFLTLISGKEFLTSATIRNNKLYTIFQENESYSVRSKVYELKDGPIIDIGKSVKTYQLDNNFVGFDIELLDVLDDSQDSQNRLWMRAEFNDNPDEQGIPSYKNWVGYLNLSDMSLKTDSSFINFPTHENFPVDKFTVNTIKNEFGLALYITGGHIQAKDKDEFSFSNSFYKYNFTTKEWVDMTYLANGKLKPLILHKSLVIYNRYIVILGGNTKKSKDELERLNGNETEYKFNSFYNLTVFDTFTNKWENVSIKPNVFDTSVATLQFDLFIAVVYNNKIIVIGRYIREGMNFHVDVTPTIGILDYNSKTWNWSPVYHEDGSKYNSSIYADIILVYNDQLIMPAGILKYIYIYYY